MRFHARTDHTSNSIGPIACKAVQPGGTRAKKEWFSCPIVGGGKIRIKTRYVEADMQKEGVTLQGDSAPMPQAMQQ